MKGKQSDAGEFLTVEEAAGLVGLSHWTLRSWLGKGLLTRYKSASRIVVNRTELLERLRPKKSVDRAHYLRKAERHSVVPNHPQEAVRKTN